MKSLVLALLLTICAAPLCAAEAQKAAPAEPQAAQPSANATEQAEPGHYACKYYTVKLSDGWRAIVPPEDQQGTVNAIFATDSGSTIVTMVAGPSGGADVRTIAEMFAEQFKAPKGVTASNGHYSFTFPLQNGTATAIVTSASSNFMVTTIAGNMKQAQEFIKKSISSENWPTLLPF